MIVLPIAGRILRAWRLWHNKGYVADQLVRSIAPLCSTSTDSSDPAGPTCLTYTPDGKKLITAGSNDVIRVYTTGSDGEPTNIDDCQENNTAIAATVRR